MCVSYSFIYTSKLPTLFPLPLQNKEENVYNFWVAKGPALRQIAWVEQVCGRLVGHLPGKECEYDKAQGNEANFGRIRTFGKDSRGKQNEREHRSHAGGFCVQSSI